VCLEEEALERLGDEVRETLAVFGTLSRAARTLGEEALGGHIISMTHRLSDILAVLWLMRAGGGTGAGSGAGVGSGTAAGSGAADAEGPSMDVVPLFETIEDLAHAPGRVLEMLDD
jgi:phosphoenolpyruvate carboxylase